jgi:hypothetical protein
MGRTERPYADTTFMGVPFKKLLNFLGANFWGIPEYPEMMVFWDTLKIDFFQIFFKFVEILFTKLSPKSPNANKQ